MVDGGEKLLLFGGLPHEYLKGWEITSDIKLAEEKLGVRFEEVPTEELATRCEELGASEQGKARELAKQLINGAGKDRRAKPLAEAEIEKATRLYLAMKGIVQERGADAVTIVCSPWIRGSDMPVPCVALTLLQEEGIPAACQGDIDALLTMILFKRASGLASFMGGAIKAGGHLGVNHCVLSRRMLGTMTPQQPYYLGDYHGRKNSPTIHTGIPKGTPVTVARLNRNLENLILASGRAVGDQDLKDRCRNTIVIEVKDRARVLRAVKGIQQHLVVACGDLRNAMTTLAKEAGIGVIAV
jgi:L-fucose isomerase-like protein